jgi:hypothetical protein
VKPKIENFSKNFFFENGFQLVQCRLIAFLYCIKAFAQHTGNFSEGVPTVEEKNDDYALIFGERLYGAKKR